MKEWKQDIVERIVARAQDEKIVRIRDIATEADINHIGRQDTMDIMAAVLKRLPDYRAVMMMDTPTASMFQALTFMENDVEFESEERFRESFANA